MLQLIDSHCHIDFSAFDADREQVIEHCQQQGINKLIVPGVTQSGWEKLINLRQQYPLIQVALGLHPCFVEQHQDHDLDILQRHIEQYKPIAIGEIGLDFFIHKSDKEHQLYFFKEQVRLAEKFQLPIILHARKAHDEILKVLRTSSLVGGIVHAFTGSLQQAEHYQKLGFLFGVGGALTYPRAQKLQTLFSKLPLESIVLETDAPDMPLVGQQGQRNSPENIPLVLAKLAEIRQQSTQLVAASTTANCKQLFGL